MTHPLSLILSMEEFKATDMFSWVLSWIEFAGMILLILASLFSLWINSSFILADPLKWQEHLQNIFLNYITIL